MSLGTGGTVAWHVLTGLNAYLKALLLPAQWDFFIVKLYGDESFMGLGHVGRWVARQRTSHTSLKTASHSYDIRCLVLFAHGLSLQWEMALEGVSHRNAGDICFCIPCHGGA